MTEENKFISTKNNTQDKVQEFTEQKMEFDYLPWAPAWEIMMEIDPKASVTETFFEHYRLVEGKHQDFMVTEELPYQKTGNSSYVEVEVFMNGKKEKEIYPIMNHRNQDIPDPTMTQVNKSLKRAFVKALAKHGVGIHIYKGEDLPKIYRISIKEINNLDKIIDKFIEEFEIEDNDVVVQTIIDIANKEIKQDFDYLTEITKIEDMNEDQYGLFLRCFNAVKSKYEKDKKKK